MCLRDHTRPRIAPRLQATLLIISWPGRACRDQHDPVSGRRAFCSVSERRQAFQLVLQAEMSRLQRHFLNLSNECSFGGDRICCSGEDHLMGHGENLRVRWLPVRMEEFPELLQLLVPRMYESNIGWAGSRRVSSNWWKSLCRKMAENDSDSRADVLNTSWWHAR